MLVKLQKFYVHFEYVPFDINHAQIGHFAFHYLKPDIK